MFGRKEQPKSFATDITDKEDLQEIKEIAEMLNPNEVFVVARQSRLRPGGFCRMNISKLSHCNGPLNRSRSS